MQNGHEFEIKPAVRENVPALISLWGPSDTGKTVSALRIARGLVGPNGKIVASDTENGRALFYAGEWGGDWHHVAFDPPFSPKRYLSVYEAARKFGADCIITDSTSHVWEGEGGVLDMKDAGNNPNDFANWKTPKMDYKRFINASLRSPCHMIFCLRAKDEYAQRRNNKGKLEPHHLGLTPICGKGFIYEMTVSVMLGHDHKPVFKRSEDYHPSPMIPAIKAPGDLLDAIQPGEYLSEATGERIRAWCEGGKKVHRPEPIGQDLLDLAASAANLGTAQLQQWWGTLDGGQKRTLKPYMDGPEGYKAIAAQADEAAPAETDDPLADGPPLGPLDAG